MNYVLLINNEYFVVDRNMLIIKKFNNFHDAQDFCNILNIYSYSLNSNNEYICLNNIYRYENLNNRFYLPIQINFIPSPPIVIYTQSEPVKCLANKQKTLLETKTNKENDLVQKESVESKPEKEEEFISAKDINNFFEKLNK